MLLRSATVFLLAFVTPLSSHIPARPSAQEKVDREITWKIRREATENSQRIQLPASGH